MKLETLIGYGVLFACGLTIYAVAKAEYDLRRKEQDKVQDYLDKIREKGL